MHFTYEDTVQADQEYNPNFLKEVALPFNSPASISAKSDSVDESIYFANRKTAMEVEGAITDANLGLLRDNIRIVIAKLQNWLMPE